MKQRILWSMVLTAALVTGLLAWLVPTAQGTPSVYATRSVDGAIGVDMGDCIASPCATIGYAISQSGYDNIINVASGIYTEHITMKNGVSIYGQGWNKTIITGSFSTNQPTVYSPMGIDATTVLSGVQVAGGGNGNPNTSPNGGGILILSSSPTIINTWVNNNTGYWGGGVRAFGGSATFSNVPAWGNRGVQGGGFYIGAGASVTITSDMNLPNGTVLWNSASSKGGGIYIENSTVNLSGSNVWWNSAPQGGGIYAVLGPNLKIQGNMISWNKAESGGGGVYLDRSDGMFKNNALIGNVAAATGSMGGGAFMTGASAGMTLEGNWFEANSAVLVGGGLHLENGSMALVNANTIVSNTVAEGGAGVSIYSAGAVTFTNNIVARNVSPVTYPTGMNVYGTAARIVNNTIADNSWLGVYFHTADGIVIANNIIAGNGMGIYQAKGTTPTYTADYNDVYSNNFGNYTNVTPGAHDVSINPAFAGSGNMLAYYHLQPTSPVYKAGSLSWAPAKDIDGDARALCASMGADQLRCPSAYLPLIER